MADDNDEARTAMADDLTFLADYIERHPQHALSFAMRFAEVLRNVAKAGEYPMMCALSGAFRLR